MLQWLRSSSVRKYFWGFMCLYMLNLSVDAPDPIQNNYPQDLAFNDQESIIELVVEKVLGFETAIVEFDDNDTSHEQRQKKNLALDLYVLHDFLSKIEHNFGLKNKQISIPLSEDFKIRYSEVYSPPPEV